jgi:hypothetical protein
MNFLKPTKEKFKLFLIIILSVIAVSVLYVFVMRFLVPSHLLVENPTYYRLSYFFTNILRNFIIACLIIMLYKKRISLKGEYYSVFKIFIILTVFSYLHHLFISMIASIYPKIFFTNLINIEFVVVNILFCYFLASVVYKFKS